MEADQPPVDKIPVVSITPKGIFKYILINGEMDCNGEKKQLTYVRGN